MSVAFDVPSKLTRFQSVACLPNGVHYSSLTRFPNRILFSNFLASHRLLYSALLQYSKNLEYGDSLVSDDSWESWFLRLRLKVTVGAAVALPALFAPFVPQPGEGPDRATMEAGYATIHGHGTAVVSEPSSSDAGENILKTLNIAAKFRFNKDIGYLYTAAFLVEVGMLLKDKSGYIAGGVKTPAAALGSDLTQRLLDKLDCSLEICEENS